MKAVGIEASNFQKICIKLTFTYTEFTENIENTEYTEKCMTNNSFAERQMH